MVEWIVRPKEDNEIYAPDECPQYNSPDLFTIKLFHGGLVNEDPKDYVGGGFSYIDFCNVDQMSIIEICSMLKDCGFIGYNALFYKLARTTMDRGLWSLETDGDILDMCELLSLQNLRIVYVYSVTHTPLLSVTAEGQEYFPSQDFHFDFVEERAREMHNEMPNEEGGDQNDDEPDAYQMREEYSDSEDEDYEASDEDTDQSFFSDGSNVDSTDDEVCIQKEARQKRATDREKEKEKKEAEKSKLKEKQGRKEQPTARDNAKDKQTIPKDRTKKASDNDKDKGKQQVEYSSDETHYAGSDEERMAGNSTDEEEINYPTFNVSEMHNPKFELGMLFPTAKLFREAVKKQAIIDRRPIKQCRNYGSRVKFICDGEECEWKIYCSKMQNSDTYQVKVYQPKHSCLQTFHQKQINSRWIANHYENEIRMNPTWHLSAFHKKVVNDWNCHISIHAIGRAKRKALEKINGNHAEQYSKLWDYASELKKAMPESTIIVMTEDGQAEERKKFKRFYTCFGPIKKGFKAGCRPLVGLDGCHLKGPYGGQLLTAVGSDANDVMYPLAWAVVEAENSDSWNWFLKLVVEDLMIDNDGSWTFISDRQKASDKEKGCEKQVKRRVKKQKTGAEILEGDAGSQTPTTHIAATTPTKASASRVGGGRPTSKDNNKEVSASSPTTSAAKGSKTTTGKPAPTIPERSKRIITRPSRFALDSQGGVFTKKKKAPAPKLTPLGIQPEDFGDNRNAPVTSLRKLEQAKRENRKKFAEKAAWKI